MKKLITEQHILALQKAGKTTVEADKNTIFTPSALDRMRASGFTVAAPAAPVSVPVPAPSQAPAKTVALGSDHTGFAAKALIAKLLQDKGFTVIDKGTNSTESCDYPDFALAVASAVILREAAFGVILDATGIPSAITANKLPGIRAATCYNEFSARSARSHNNANVLVMGAKTLGDESLKSILDTWLAVPFEGGRHQKRLDKISRIESVIVKELIK